MLHKLIFLILFIGHKIHHLSGKILSNKIYLLSNRILSDKIYILSDMILSVKINLLSDRILLDKIHNLSGKILTVKINLYLTWSCHLRLRNTECSIYEVPGLRRRGSRGRGANREKWSTGKEVKRVRCKGVKYIVKMLTLLLPGCLTNDSSRGGL